MQNLHNEIDCKLSIILQAYRNRKSGYIMALLTLLEINSLNQETLKLLSFFFFLILSEEIRKCKDNLFIDFVD